MRMRMFLGTGCPGYHEAIHYDSKEVGGEAQRKTFAQQTNQKKNGKSKDGHKMNPRETWINILGNGDGWT